MSTETGMTTPAWVAEVVGHFEQAGFFDESDVAGRVSAAAKKIVSPMPEEEKAANAERWAFHFMPQTNGELTEWKTHFGPIFVNGDFRNPDIDWIDETTIKYWEMRMTAVKHPLLRARYADLVWDMSKPKKIKAPLLAAQIAIDGYVAASRVADGDTTMPAADRLERALKLAMGIGDKGRAEQARDAFFDLISRVNETWAWVTLYDAFEEQAKISLTNAQRSALIAGLEAHVTEASSKPQGVDPAVSFHVAGRLVRHYQRLGQQPEADRVVMVCAQAAERFAGADTDNTRAHFWLDQVFRFYRVNSLDAEAERVQIEARRRGELARHEAKPLEAEVDIPPEELEKFMNELTDGDLDTAIKTIVGHFVPNLDELRDRLQRFRKEFPMATMWPINKMSEGQVVGVIGPVDSDPDGALLNAVADYIRYSKFFLLKAFDRLRERYSVTPKQLVDYLFESPAFTIRFQSIIQQGVEAYFVGDHLKAISLLVPQIENALRFLLTLVGRPPNKPKRGDQPGMTEKTLTDILEHEPVIRERFGDDAHLYMVAFLADSRGMNIRNRMCHGLMGEDDFNRWVSDRVLHTLLLVGSCRRKLADAPPSETDKPGESSVGDLSKAQ